MLFSTNHLKPAASSTAYQLRPLDAASHFPRSMPRRQANVAQRVLGILLKCNGRLWQCCRQSGEASELR